MLVWLAACGQEENPGLGERVIPLGQPVPKGGGRYQVGKPYEIAGVRYFPKEDQAYDRSGMASWYGELFHGRYTANGEIYDMDRLSAAHPTLPLPVYAHVTNLDNGRSLIVRINDRGPFKKGRIIDLSRRSAEILGYRRRGTASVRVRYLRRAPLNGDDSYERDYLSGRAYVHAPHQGKRPVKKGPDTVAGRSGSALPPLPDRPERPAKAPAQIASAPLRPSAPVRTAMALGPPTVQEDIPSTLPSTLPTQSRPPIDGPAIQAGSFRDRANAERARTALSSIAEVHVDTAEVDGQTYYLVLVGPFADGIEAATALPLVTDAGYGGARIVLKN